jgi:FAD/FMN-containing dehydrogenase
MLETKVKDGITGELKNIAGEENVSSNRADLYIYSQDMTQAAPSWPDLVVMPQSVEEVQAIIRLANREKIPVTPYTTGGNISGLTIPLKGGIVMDLRRMNRIIEVNEADMYAVVEPGVTFGMMKAYLDNYHLNLVYTYAYSPPSTSVMANALVQGLDTFSYRYGAASHWVSGLEVVLPTGELVKIGSSAASNTWQAIVPFPEMSGLFLGWQGATGIITKMAVSLWPKPKCASAMTFALRDMDSAYDLVQAISRTRLPDDITGGSNAWQKMERLAAEHIKTSIYPALTNAPDEPEFLLNASLSGNNEKELAVKTEILEELAHETIRDNRLMEIQKFDGKSAPLPMQMLGVLSSGGGLTWVGTYGPMSKWLEVLKKGCEIQDKYNITRSSYTRIMNEGHFAAVRWLLPFDKGDPEMVKRITDLSLEQLEMVISTGYIPYKTPFWAIRKLEQRLSPEWLNLHRSVKAMLDPNNIMNPGRWGANPGDIALRR